MKFTHWGEHVDIRGTSDVYPDGWVHFYVENGGWAGRYDPNTKTGWAVDYPDRTWYMGDII